jgi:hypothetical protein
VAKWIELAQVAGQQRVFVAMVLNPRVQQKKRGRF